jgi:hypothetical protein
MHAWLAWGLPASAQDCQDAWQQQQEQQLYHCQNGICMLLLHVLFSNAFTVQPLHILLSDF